MTHHPDQLAQMARLRHAEDIRAARRHVLADVTPAERRALLRPLARLLARKPEETAYARRVGLA